MCTPGKLKPSPYEMRSIEVEKMRMSDYNVWPKERTVEHVKALNASMAARASQLDLRSVRQPAFSARLCVRALPVCALSTLHGMRRLPAHCHPITGPLIRLLNKRAHCVRRVLASHDMQPGTRGRRCHEDGGILSLAWHTW